MLKRWRLWKIELLEDRERYLLHLTDKYRGGLKESAEMELLDVEWKLKKLRRKITNG